MDHNILEFFKLTQGRYIDAFLRTPTRTVIPFPNFSLATMDLVGYLSELRDNRNQGAILRLICEETMTALDFKIGSSTSDIRTKLHQNLRDSGANLNW